ncbi:hypothetical protein [Streptosporangium roseum]|uniref:Uncharacterized protein n=1 Tax=Streptosporangium roseum (strain ATCC 12428 / DSM 43021 / JCM 3005 / KCTC 9067 / NCIMB 10171 / NRRL 2505 / NI 9100) TaxID=479432 RepID=D2AUH8_STRRD|nr:hypothetical protein [Streptosporangium roseum]ACZ84840.1 hypothetical protein Sros_1852 [Streptosporangium roseum DSM 43021]
MSATSKPDIAEMRKTLREFRKVERDRKLARGKAKPRTRREWEIWEAGVKKRLGTGDDDA